MDVVIGITPEEGAAFKAQATAEGLSVEEWLKKLGKEKAAIGLRPMRADNLADLLLDSAFAGSELDLERVRDAPRPVEIG